MDELSQVLTSGPKNSCWEKKLLIWASKNQQPHTPKARGSVFIYSNGLQNPDLKGLWFKGNIDNR